MAWGPGGGEGERVAVLWVGHGSATDAAVGDVVLEHVARARAALPGVVQEVAFWRGEPGLRQALARIAAERVVIMPCFISAGYFVDRVVPRELGVDGAQVGVWQRVGPRWVWWAPPLGLLAEAGAVVAARLEEALAVYGPARAGQGHVLVVGHGTRRHDASATPAYEAAAALEDRLPDGWSARAAFIDQAPRVSEALLGCAGEDAVVIPHFMAPGGHTRVDIPAALGVVAGAGWPQRGAHGGRVVVTAETGSAQTLSDAAVRQVQAALACAPPPREGDARATLPVDEAARWFFDLLYKDDGEHLVAGPICFGQLSIARSPEGWHMTHVQASGQDTPDRPWLDAADEDALHRLIRRDAQGHTRGLLGAPTLPEALRVLARDDAALIRALAIIYPGAALARWAEAHGALTPTPLSRTLARHTGLLASLRTLPEDLATTRALSLACAGCLRRPVWAGTDDAAHDLPGGLSLAPCDEACVAALAALVEDGQSA